MDLHKCNFITLKEWQILLATMHIKPMGCFYVIYYVYPTVHMISLCHEYNRFSSTYRYTVNRWCIANMPHCILLLQYMVILYWSSNVITSLNRYIIYMQISNITEFLGVLLITLHPLLIMLKKCLIQLLHGTSICFLR